MENFIQHSVSGVMTGSIYGVMALALVMIFQATGVFNFSQGEMATFTTFLAWSLLLSLPYGVVFILAIIIAFLIGVALERGLIRLVEQRSPMDAVIVTLGLFLIFNSLSNAVYGPEPHGIEQPFRGGPIRIADITLGQHNVFLFGVAMAITLIMFGLFQFTKLGLAMRATAHNRIAAELMGVPTGQMLMLGWGLAAAVGVAAGIVVAPIAILSPNMMFFVLLFGFAGAVLGGLDSAPGAIVGGILVGLTQNLVGVYIDDWVDFLHLPFDIANPNQYRDVVALGLIVLVLVIRPRGLFGRPQMQRV